MTHSSGPPGVHKRKDEDEKQEKARRRRRRQRRRGRRSTVKAMQHLNIRNKDAQTEKKETADAGTRKYKRQEAGREEDGENAIGKK